MRTGLHAQLVHRASLLARAEAADVFRFIAADERRAAYLVVLYGLLERRRAHEIEVAHEDLYALVAPAVEALQGAPYDAARFRQDIEQLRAWHNLTLRLEAARIRSIADRRRERFLVRLEPETAALLEYLEARLDPVLPSADAGANLLTDIADALSAASRLLKRRTATDDDLIRVLHLIAECDGRTDRVAGELCDFRDRLVAFVAEPFRVASIVDLSASLERYLDAYLARLHTAGARIRRKTERMLSDDARLLLVRASEAQARRLVSQPFGSSAARPREPREILGGLLAFFAPDGRLDALCDRVNRETREAVRRIHRYVEEVRLKNVRTEAIRARAAELAALPEEQSEVARHFVERLVASAHVPADSRTGTPGERASPFRPARRHETRRPAFRGQTMEGKRASVEAHREMERARLFRLSRFVDERILAGRPAAALSNVELAEPPQEYRSLVEALKVFFLYGGKRKSALGYTVARAAQGARASFSSRGYALDSPDLVFQQRSR